MVPGGGAVMGKIQTATLMHSLPPSSVFGESGFPSGVCLLSTALTGWEGWMRNRRARGLCPPQLANAKVPGVSSRSSQGLCVGWGTPSCLHSWGVYTGSPPLLRHTDVQRR